MLGIGMGEMILIGVIALIIFGPEKFPDFAKIAIRTMRDIRGYMDDIQREVTKELNPLKKEIKKLSSETEQYIDKLSKETDLSDALDNKSSSSTSSNVDPTDRQDDSSYTYAPVRSTPPGEEELPAKEEESGEDIATASDSAESDVAAATSDSEQSDAAATMSDAAPRDAAPSEFQESGSSPTEIPDAVEAPEKDEFDLTEPPPERLG